MRRSPSRQGFLLLDMMLTLVIVALLMTIVVQLIGVVLRIHRELADTGRQAAAIQRVVTTLRRDTLAAPQFRAIGNGCDLGNGLTWTADGDTLVRQTPQGEERFGPLAFKPAIEVKAEVVHLRLGEEAKWSLRRLSTEGPR